MFPTFQRTFARNVSEYLGVAAEVENFCARHDLPRHAASRVLLGLEELLLNLIDHATGSVTNCVELHIDLEPNRTILVLRDDADAFDPRSAPLFDKAKPLEERGPRGMGIHLVRTLAREIDYARVDGRNRLRVVIDR